MRELVLARSIQEAQQLTSELGPGYYELRGRFHHTTMTDSQVQANMRRHFARWLNKQQLELHLLARNANTIRFELRPRAAAGTQQLSDDQFLQAALTPALLPQLIILSVAAIVGIFLTWRLIQELNAFVQLIPEPIRDAVGVGVATLSGGLGVLLIVGGVIWLYRTMRRKEAHET